MASYRICLRLASQTDISESMLLEATTVAKAWIHLVLNQRVRRKTQWSLLCSVIKSFYITCNWLIIPLSFQPWYFMYLLAIWTLTRYLCSKPGHTILNWWIFILTVVFCFQNMLYNINSEIMWQFLKKKPNLSWDAIWLQCHIELHD